MLWREDGAEWEECPKPFFSKVFDLYTRYMKHARNSIFISLKSYQDIFQTIVNTTGNVSQTYLSTGIVTLGTLLDLTGLYCIALQYSTICREDSILTKAVHWYDHSFTAAFITALFHTSSQWTKVTQVV